MLEYSKAAYKRIVDRVKRMTYVCDVTVQALMIFYLVYAICTDAGKLWANIPLLVVCTAYLLYFLISTKANPLYKRTITQKRMVRLVKYSKLFIKFCTLGVTLYGIYVATTHVTALSIILAALSLVGWLLQVIFEVIKIIIEDVGVLIKEAVTADVETMMKPVTTVKNFFKKATGKEIDQPKEKSKHRLWLDEKVQQVRAQRLEQKLAKKQAKKDKKHKKELPASQPTLLIETKEEKEENDATFNA